MVSAAEEPDQQEDSVSQMLQDKLLDEIEFDDMQKMLDEIMEDHSFSVRKALINLINGDEPISKETVRSFLYSLFFSEIQNEKGLVLKLLLIILIAAVLAEFADVFRKRAGGKHQFLYCLSCLVYDSYGKLYAAWKCAYAASPGTCGVYESSVPGLFYDSDRIHRCSYSSCFL